MRPYKRDDIIAALNKLEEAEIICSVPTSSGGKERPSVKYYAKDVKKLITMH